LASTRRTSVKLRLQNLLDEQLEIEQGGGRIRATGNSFAAPHLAGRAALIRAAHPDASPFEVKTILAATADDPRT